MTGNMVKYLLQHRISVIVAFVAVTILGAVTYKSLPVTLMPDIPIPHMSVNIVGNNLTCEEIEDAITAPLRRILLQVAGIEDIHSVSYDGSGVIELDFCYGINPDLAFIEVNEKVDDAMNSLPYGTQRPKVVKSSATDIPILYLNFSLKEGENNESAFLDLGDYVRNEVRHRIEQLPQVAIADMTGVQGRRFILKPDLGLMKSVGLNIGDIEAAISNANLSNSSMMVRDGHYEYYVEIQNRLTGSEEIACLPIRKGERILQIGDFVDINQIPDSDEGIATIDDRRAVVLAIIKQADANVGALKNEIEDICADIKKTHPDINIEVTRDQSELLEYAISNLVQNLILGLILVFIVAAIFMRDTLSSVVVSITILISVIITSLLFYLFHVSLNIISLCGLILAIGMMIDNAVIVTENITQWRQNGLSIAKACDKGTTELITPLLSSSLTTVAVFLPLVFLSGISGAIFSDQAFAITAGLGVSYLTGIMLLPVVYRSIYGRKRAAPLSSREDHRMERVYDKVMSFCFSHWKILTVGTILSSVAGIWITRLLPMERMPNIEHTDFMMHVDWNMDISAEENAKRCKQIGELARASGFVEKHTAESGVQGYLMSSSTCQTKEEATFYFDTRNPMAADSLKSTLYTVMSKYPNASVEFLPSENIFDKIFSSNSALMEVRLSRMTERRNPEPYLKIEKRIRAATGEKNCPVALRERIRLIPDNERISLYGADATEVRTLIDRTLRGNDITSVRMDDRRMLVGTTGIEGNPEQIFSSIFVSTSVGKDGKRGEIPLTRLITISGSKGLREINAGKEGEYVSLSYDGLNSPKDFAESVSGIVSADSNTDVELTGSWFAGRHLMKEMFIVLIVSLLLMYFILCAQFESFLQPLIVLIEIPIDFAFSIFTLLLFGESLNLMSAIGIIVACGIVINDSILKIDAINRLRKEGYQMTEAIHIAGRKRLRAILMTSLTTIVAMLFVCFTKDLGSELQRPLAIALIGAMTLGTLVSLFVIPIFYWLIYRKKTPSSPQKTLQCTNAQ